MGKQKNSILPNIANLEKIKAQTTPQEQQQIAKEYEAQQNEQAIIPAPPSSPVPAQTYSAPVYQQPVQSYAQQQAKQLQAQQQEQFDQQQAELQQLKRQQEEQAQEIQQQKDEQWRRNNNFQICLDMHDDDVSLCSRLVE